MPFKSEAQRRKFYALKSEGKMSQKTIDEWNKETKDVMGDKKLPDRLVKLARLFLRMEKEASMDSAAGAFMKRVPYKTLVTELVRRDDSKPKKRRKNKHGGFVFKKYGEAAYARQQQQ